MKSITIHGLDSTLDALIRDKAKRHGTSLNKAIKRTLKESLGDLDDKESRKAEFVEFCGFWSAKDEKEFQIKTKHLETIDTEDWS